MDKGIQTLKKVSQLREKIDSLIESLKGEKVRYTTIGSNRCWYWQDGTVVGGRYDGDWIILKVKNSKTGKISSKALNRSTAFGGVELCGKGGK